MLYAECRITAAQLAAVTEHLAIGLADAQDLSRATSEIHQPGSLWVHNGEVRRVAPGRKRKLIDTVVTNAIEFVDGSRDQLGVTLAPDSAWSVRVHHAARHRRDTATDDGPMSSGEDLTGAIRLALAARHPPTDSMKLSRKIATPRCDVCEDKSPAQAARS